jgi:hypothetical protein
VTGPCADRPSTPGYRVLPADQGSGLIPWPEAERRLTERREAFGRALALSGEGFVGSPARWTSPGG